MSRTDEAESQAVVVDQTVGPLRIPGYAEIGDGFYEIAVSPNGRYRVGWDDSAPGGDVGGERFSGRGRWIVLDGEQVFSQGTLERPNDGAIADSGRFILTDWLFGDRLAEEFYASEPDGTVIIAERLGATARTSAISPDGRFAAVATAANPSDPAWSLRLLAFDLEARRRIWNADLPDQVGSIAIDTAGDGVRIEFANGGRLDARLRDGFIDPAALRSTTFSIDPWLVVHVIADELEAAGDPLDARAVEQWSQELDAAVRGMKRYVPDGDPKREARAWRLKGEMAERLGRVSDALEAYIRAVDLDPHISVRRRIRALGGTVAPAPARRRDAEPLVDLRPYASEVCPSCGVRLSPLPKAKKRCPGCGQPTYVRGGPDGRRHLLREDQLAEHEAWWARGEAERAEARERAEKERRAAGLLADRAAGLLVGDYRPTVVGDSVDQGAIISLVGERKPRGLRAEFVAELVQEPTSTPGHNAVGVLIDGREVGQLSHHDVELVAPMLQRLEHGRGPGRCRVIIVGGFDDARPDYGVYIKGIPNPQGDQDL